MTETLANGYSSEILSESYPMNTNMTCFRWFLNIFVLWMKVAAALEGFKSDTENRLMLTVPWSSQIPGTVYGLFRNKIRFFSYYFCTECIYLLGFASKCLKDGHGTLKMDGLRVRE